ncbi:MAG: penicillin-binding protein 2 [Clostridia bacterium]|nr:penicillin-binding protein 2 [Clostridia bacterium]
MKDNSKGRFFIIFIILFAIVIGFVAKLYIMQIINGDEYVAKTVVSIPHTYTVEAVRGDIYDRNGVLLAYNTESFNLYLSRAYKVTDELNQSLLALMTILDNNKETYVNHLESYFDFGNMQFSDELTNDDIISWQMNTDLFNLKNNQVILNPDEFFAFMRKFFSISDSYTDQEAYKIMIIRYEILKNRWYWLSGESLLISKNITEDTLAEVSEQKHIIQGIIIRPSTSRQYGDENFNLFINKIDNSEEELNQSLLTIVNILDKNEEPYINHLKDYFDFEKKRFSVELSDEDIVNWQTDKHIFHIGINQVMMNPEEFFIFMRDYFSIDESYTEQEAYKIMILKYEIAINSENWIAGDHLLISENLTNSTISDIYRYKLLTQGVVIGPLESGETSNVVDVAHVLGYVGMVTPEDVTEKGYEADSMIGKTGVEDYAEDLLKGKNGYTDVITDSSGNIISTEGGAAAIDGNDIYLTINMSLQKVAMDSLKKNIEIIKEKATPGDKRNFADASAGAVVAMDVNTGEVLTMVNFPSYNPSWFIHNDEVSKQKRLEVLLGSKETSLFNRATEGLYTPGSTFKPIVAIAGLEENIITKDTLIFDPGHKVIGDWDFYCLEYVMYHYTHGYLDVIEAIKTSCNMFFYILGTDTKIDAIDKWAKAFGLGEKTGIDLYGESKGIRSNPDYKYSQEFEKWYTADTAQSSIGQLYHSYTPLQLTVYTAALANGGKVLTPFVIGKAVSKSGETVYESETKYTQVPWSQETFETIRTAMASVVLDGTAEVVFGDDYPISVAGKTGTAETGREANESSNAVFICYAPIENPQIAIAVVIENGVWGSYAAPVAKDILNEYFGLNYKH